MANGALPDFRIQWLDKTKLRYSLRTGRVHIKGPEVGSLCWEGGMNDDVLSWLNASDKVKGYLLLSQEMMKRCISISNSEPSDVSANVSVHFEEMTEKELMSTYQGVSIRRSVDGENSSKTSLTQLPLHEEKMGDEIDEICVHSQPVLFPSSRGGDFIFNDSTAIISDTADRSDDNAGVLELFDRCDSTLSLEQQ